MKTQHEKIIFAMQKCPDHLFIVSEFAGIPNEFNDQVGYKAGTRMSELAKDGYLEVVGKYKRKIVYYRITPKGIKVDTLRKYRAEHLKEKNMFLRATEWLFS